MKLNKKVLSCAALLGIALATLEASKYERSVSPVEQTKGIDNSIYNNSKLTEALNVYNRYLKEYGICLDEVDIEYFASLSDNPNLVTFKSEYGIFDYYDINNCAIIPDDDYFRLAYISNDEVFYNNLLNLDFSTGENLEEVEKLIPATRFIEANNIKIDGYTLTYDDENRASDDAYAEITEVYGEKVGMCIRELGLPIPYYNAEAFYEAKDNVIANEKELKY